LLCTDVASLKMAAGKVKHLQCGQREGVGVLNDSQHPLLRSLEIIPLGDEDEGLFVLRDPQGMAEPTVIPLGAAMIATLLNGQRTLAEIEEEFHSQFGHAVDVADIAALVRQLDERNLLETDRFRRLYREQIRSYLDDPVRPAAHAGGAYASEPKPLREQLASLFTHPQGPGEPGEPAGDRTRRLCGVLSPHIDLHRGGPAFAWAYKHLLQHSVAERFVIFGTAHNPMKNLFSVSRKHFQTPLGTVETDQELIDRLADEFASAAGLGSGCLFEDELAHRHEHSIEFQALFLQHLFGSRIKIVPVLTGSFHQYVADGRSPWEDAQVRAFVEAMRRIRDQLDGRLCFISGGDLAHIGRRFGDPELLSQQHLDDQRQNDLELLGAASEADPEGFFRHVATRQDASRICGLSPTYTMMQVIQPRSGELLCYDQAVEQDGSACVSFASLAFYHDDGS